MVGTRPSRDREGSRDPRGAIGRVLYEARLARGVSLDHISGELSIPIDHLRALEEGDLRVFPAEVYARGAYEKYARYLNVDTRQSHYVFLRSLSQVRERVPLRLPLPSTWFQRMLRPSVVLVVFVSLAVLGVATYLSWQVRSFLAVPDLVLMEPSETVLESRSVIVRGRADKNSQVAVNGEVVLLNEDSVFETELPLRPGINVLQVEAVGVSGRANVKTQDILVPRT